MNEKQPFEERISDKLQRLPLPDTESSWQQMKSLLDDKMPRGAGFRPYGRWWWAGMIAVVITAFIWFVDEQYKSADKLSSVQTEKKSPGNSATVPDKNNDAGKSIAAGATPGDSHSLGQATEPNGNNSNQKESTHQETVKEKNDRTSTLNAEGNKKPQNQETAKPDVSPAGASVFPPVKAINTGRYKTELKRI